MVTAALYWTLEIFRYSDWCLTHLF